MSQSIQSVQSVQSHWRRLALVAAAAALSAVSHAAPGGGGVSPPPNAAPVLPADRGAPQQASAALEDEIPLPVPEVVVAGEQGDTVVEPRSGDPYFLGFIAGKYYPPKDVRLDPSIGDAIARLGTDGRPHDDVYAFVILKKRLTQERLASLQSLGVRPLGVQPHYALQAAIPAAALPEVAAHEAVQWVGIARPWQKVHPHLIEQAMAKGPGAELDVYVNVFESDLCAESSSLPGPVPVAGGPGEAALPGGAGSDAPRLTSNGWMQRSLETQGVSIRQYLPKQNAFVARLREDRLAAVVSLDFVQFVEAVVRPRAMHDESMPLVLADYGRVTADGGSSQSAIAGIVDSGFDATHTALDHVFWVGWNESGDPGGIASDVCGHGTHVAGTILGEPDPADASHRGAAPGLATWQGGRFRIVKWLGDDCLASTVPLADVLAHFRGSFVDSFGVGSSPPAVVNNSYGTPGSWTGTELDARTVDDEVFDEDRIFVFAAGNEGSSAGTICLPAVAKNALTVGSVYDYKQSNSELPGSISSTSSRGPCADGRWKPNVVAPGTEIKSVLAGSGNALTNKTGTSQAAPHVTGLLAQLADQHPWMMEPQQAMSMLQATALTYEDAVLANETDAHLDLYGCGRVNAAKVLNYFSNDWDWNSWTVTPAATIGNPTYEYSDFFVPANSRRLVVCMTYVEPAALAGASQALLHDFDLFIDQPPVNTTTGNSGEFTAQQSTVDNTEIRIIENPVSGTWRWKAFPTATLAPLFDTPKMAVTVVAIGGDTTPNASASVVADDLFVRPGETVDIDATVAVNQYIGSAVFLDSTVSPVQPLFTAASTELVDGETTDLLGNHHFGRDVLLGDILGQSSRTAKWSMYWASEGAMTFDVDVESDNLGGAALGGTVVVTVDGTPPSAPASLVSSSHQPNVWSNLTKITGNWPAATDGLSGIAGYSFAASLGGPSAPDQNIETIATMYSLTLPSATTGYSLNVKAADKSGNWSSGFASSGPYLIDGVPPAKVLNLKSPTHSATEWSNKPLIMYTWQAAPDAHSGVDGYSLVTKTGSPALPDTAADIGVLTSHSEILPTAALGYYFNVRSVDEAGNWDDEAASIGPFRIDLLAPSAPSNLTSSSHAIGVSSTNDDVTVSWTAATDAHSGVAGYLTEWDHSPSTMPTGAIDTTATTLTATLAPSAQGNWFHVRARDVAGNLGPTIHLGPFTIALCGATAGSQSYGIGKPGQFGIPQLVATSPPILGATAAIEIQFGLPGALPILLLGAAQASTPFDGGFLLVAPTLVLSLPVPLGAGGNLALAGALPLDPALCGASLYLQALIPDPGAGGLNHLAMTPGLQLTLGS